MSIAWAYSVVRGGVLCGLLLAFCTGRLIANDLNSIVYESLQADGFKKQIAIERSEGSNGIYYRIRASQLGTLEGGATREQEFFEADGFFCSGSSPEIFCYRTVRELPPNPDSDMPVWEAQQIEIKRAADGSYNVTSFSYPEDDPQQKFGGGYVVSKADFQPPFEGGTFVFDHRANGGIRRTIKMFQIPNGEFSADIFETTAAGIETNTRLFTERPCSTHWEFGQNRTIVVMSIACQSFDPNRPRFPVILFERQSDSELYLINFFKKDSRPTEPDSDYNLGRDYVRTDAP